MNLAPVPARWLERATARRAVAGRFPRRVSRGQVFILPTPFGYLAAGAVLVFLLLGLNYQNAPAFALAFLLGGLGFVSMVAAHRHLVGLSIAGAAATPVFAGDPIPVRLTVANRSRRVRRGLCAYSGPWRSSPQDAASGAEIDLELLLPARRRGRHALDGLGLDSSEPFAVFRAWCRLRGPMPCTVYPRPAAAVPPPPGELGSGLQASYETQPEDFRGLARYRPGDRPSQIAWAAYARTGVLERKELAGGGGGTAWFDFATTPGTGHEAKLSVLARWLLDAERLGTTVYGLRLPGYRCEPARGSRHLATCLLALASYPGPYDDAALQTH